MKRRGVLGAVAAAFVLVTLGCLTAPALAQEIPQLPPPPYVPPPEQLAPVFELIAPTVFPACGTANLGVFLARQSADTDPFPSIRDALVSNGVPPEVADQIIGAVPESVKAYPKGTQIVRATTPFFVICGAIPRPPEQLTCLLDAQAQEAVSTVGRQAETPLPLGLHPAGDAVEQVITVEDKLPPPARGNGLGSLAAQLLVCAVPAGGPSPGGDFSAPPSSGGYEPPGSSPFQYPPLALSPVVAQPPLVIPPAPTARRPRALPVGDAVIYGVVWLLPLAMLVFGGYAGGSLTREIKVSA